MPNSFHINFIRPSNHFIYDFGILLSDIQHDEHFTRQQICLRRLIPRYLQVNRDRGSWCCNNHTNFTYCDQLLVQLQPFKIDIGILVLSLYGSNVHKYVYHLLILQSS